MRKKICVFLTLLFACCALFGCIDYEYLEYRYEGNAEDIVAIELLEQVFDETEQDDEEVFMLHRLPYKVVESLDSSKFQGFSDSMKGVSVEYTKYYDEGVLCHAGQAFRITYKDNTALIVSWGASLTYDPVRCWTALFTYNPQGKVVESITNEKFLYYVTIAEYYFESEIKWYNGDEKQVYL